MAQFRHYDLRLITPSFDSRIVPLILALEELRKKRVELTTHPELFQGVKRLFHIVESVASARIEGNHTTVVDYLDSQRGLPIDVAPSSPQEIDNIGRALRFIEETILDYPLNKGYLLELHRRVVEGLPTGPGEGGDPTPGSFRSGQAQITKSDHLPPDALAVEGYIDELLEFVQREDGPQYDLIKIALAHHRFVWIHPFHNGNGRTVRLFTYALLMKYGFRVATAERILNPTAVFCNDRQRYYDTLMEADKGTDEGLENWCTYVLEGLHEEIGKVDRLAEHRYLASTILRPAVESALKQKDLSADEARILMRAIELQVIQNRDLKELFPSLSDSAISKKIRALLEGKFLVMAPDSKRKYILRLTQNALTVHVMKMLSREGFLGNLE